MLTRNRRSLLAALAGTVTAVFALGAQAQSGYPNKPIRVVVPYAAGGNMEHWRPTLAKVGQLLGQQLIVDNRPGAGGNIGSDAVAKSPPDGYTLVIGTIGTHAINPSVYRNMPYDALKDFSPVVALATMANVVIVPPATPVKNLAEFIAYAKAQKRPMNFGTPGNGSSAHLTGALFGQVTGMELQHVPYKGSAPALTDLLGGRLDVMFDNVPLPLQHILAGRLRALAVTSAQRSPVLPDMPTLAESGLVGFDVSSWYGIYAPAGVPAEIVARLNAAFNEALRTPEIRQQLNAQGWTVTGGTPEQLGQFTRGEHERWARVVTSANIRID